MTKQEKRKKYLRQWKKNRRAWIKANDPVAYQKILDADRARSKKFFKKLKSNPVAYAKKRANHNKNRNKARKLLKKNNPRKFNQFLKKERARTLINNKTRRSQENYNSTKIIEGLVPSFMTGVKIREEQFRYIILDLFARYNLFCYNELFLGESGGNRQSYLADLYIPALDYLIEVKRNRATTTSQATLEQLQGSVSRFSKSFGRMPGSYTSVSINGAGADLNALEFFEDLQNKILIFLASKKGKIIVNKTGLKREINAIISVLRSRKQYYY